MQMYFMQVRQMAEYNNNGKWFQHSQNKNIKFPSKHGCYIPIWSTKSYNPTILKGDWFQF